ncbi:MAG TPA: hypothetical protein VEK79_20875 [Thermoanaerobaculia bacterium]|nr:hypothetical protein [Thermoanaerobaculia bacterium]
MFVYARVVFIALLFASVSAAAQNATGHWEGAIHTPQGDVTIAVDIAKNAAGEIVATFDNPARGVRGFPLSKVVLNGLSVTFAINAAGGGTFKGTFNGDAVEGTFTTRGPDGQPLELAFDLVRKGDAAIASAPKSGAIAKNLEGKWTGTLEVEGTQRQLGLSLTNADGSATGFMSSEGLDIPIASIVQSGSSTTLDVKIIGGSYTGMLDANGTELAGTWTQGPFVGPLRFRRAVAKSESTLIDRWANAAGGREQIGAIRTWYREATIAVGGFDGTIKVWRTSDGKYRKEERISTLSTVETFDGAKGTLRQGDAPPRAMTGAELARARSTAFANAGAMFFAFFPDRRRGAIALENDDTIVLRPEGGIDWRIALDATTSLPKTMTHQQNDRTINVTFVEYETVEGIRMEKEIHRSTGDPRFDAVIRFTKTVINPPVDAAMFVQ